MRGFPLAHDIIGYKKSFIRGEIIFMARPMKKGLDYFSVDVDVYSDHKLRFLKVKFGLAGEAIFFRLLSEVYRNGYYLKWDGDISLLFADSAGCDAKFCNEVVSELVKRDFFDRRIFKSLNILTSKNIQERFGIAAKERKRVDVNVDIWMIDIPMNSNRNDKANKSADKPPINAGKPPINSINRSINSVNPPTNAQSKAKQSRGNKTKEGEAMTLSNFKKPEISHVKAYCEEQKNSVDAAQFYDFYESKDWYIGKNKMKNWQACVRSWDRRGITKQKDSKKKTQYTTEDFQNMLTDI